MHRPTFDPSDPTHPPTERRGCRPLALVLLLVGLSGAATLAAFSLMMRSRIESRLEAAEAEADRLDPQGWRLEQLNALRFQPPENANPADRVRAAFELLPPDAFRPSDNPEAPPNLGDLVKKIVDTPSNRRPDDEALAHLATSLDPLAPALAEVLPLVDAGQGRFPLEFAFNPMETLLPDIQNARAVANLLQLETARRGAAGDVDGALESCRATLGVARAIGDEPIMISQLVRSAIASVAVKSAERALGQGQASDHALAALQEQIAEEAAQPLGLYAMRGERASSNDILEKLEAGRLTIGDLAGNGTSQRSLPFAGSYFRHNRAVTLEFLNRCVEIAGRPIEEQPKLWKQFEHDTAPPPGRLAALSSAMAYLLVPAIHASGQANVRRTADQNAAIVLLAAERYRLANGGWPETIDDLEPYLPENKVPIDPYSGRPILIRRLPDGLAAYSTSVDGVDDGGIIDDLRHYMDPGHDMGYRLWDVPLRGLPAEPPPEGYLQP